MLCFVFRERLADELDETGELLADLASDQTSLHNPYGGGYWPVGVRAITWSF